MGNKINIELEKWQVKSLRNYFGENDKTPLEHWAYDVFNEAFKTLKQDKDERDNIKINDEKN